jgi:pyroglutamyl-peptidase
VLLTGFDAFGGEHINPSWESVRTLHGARLQGHRLVVRQLPTSFARAPVVLRDALRELQPHVVICVGQAGGRAQISLERVAINVCDARIVDNDGARPHAMPILERGPAAYFSRLPLDACHAALHGADIPSEISNSAGTFVCNQVMYVLLHELRRQPEVRAGFVHIPFVPAQVLQRRGTPSMALEQVVAALRAIMAATLDPSVAPRDTPASGREH